MWRMLRKATVLIVAATTRLFHIEFGDDEVRGLTFVLNNIESRFLPMNTVSRFGITDMIALKQDLVPHPIALTIVQDSPINVWTGDCRLAFPWAIRDDDWVAYMFLGGMKFPNEPMLFFDDCCI